MTNFSSTYPITTVNSSDIETEIANTAIPSNLQNYIPTLPKIAGLFNWDFVSNTKTIKQAYNCTVTGTTTTTIYGTPRYRITVLYSNEIKPIIGNRIVAPVISVSALKDLPFSYTLYYKDNVLPPYVIYVNGSGTPYSSPIDPSWSSFATLSGGSVEELGVTVGFYVDITPNRFPSNKVGGGYQWIQVRPYPHSESGERDMTDEEVEIYWTARLSKIVLSFVGY